jgi:hypothetical protein
MIDVRYLKRIYIGAQETRAWHTVSELAAVAFEWISSCTAKFHGDLIKLKLNLELLKYKLIERIT